MNLHSRQSANRWFDNDLLTSGHDLAGYGRGEAKSQPTIATDQAARWFHDVIVAHPGKALLVGFALGGIVGCLIKKLR
jgi:hypothetical protein